MNMPSLTLALACIEACLIGYAEYHKRRNGEYQSDGYYLTIIIVSAAMMTTVFFW